MGAVFRPKDLGKGYRKVIENAIKDLHPDTKDTVIRLLLSEDIKFRSWLHLMGANKIS